MGKGTFGDVPLSTLVPELTITGAESMRRAARSVGAARPEIAETRWEWRAAHAVFAGPQSRVLVILLLCVVQPTSGSGWLEFQLQVGWTAEGRHEVAAVVNVECWCETDHGTHDVEVLTFAVGDEMSLSAAFEAGAARMADWSADPRDAEFWRSRESTRRE
ncbi:hypothetical protein ACFVUN_32200 [Kitasatospora griseola]|uniref:hypothetical protein n=1 Tax=Kitasatospora griseola TaxID=2064 RepID=UPI0036DD5537